MSAPNSSQASMLSGHAQYAKGYVEETIGNVTGSKEWQESGKNDTTEGISEMKVWFSCLPTDNAGLPFGPANQQRTGEPAASGIGGKIEEVAGKAAGCEGMEKEGLERQDKANN
ncbi:hypothetical protein EG329_014273 [Mollisiaceae sp. DMI_Dod_QoI]|nr:hypothetical protein EG329_014273 [Helotiales sp. DMI_Dod_QoI]